MRKGYKKEIKEIREENKVRFNLPNSIFILKSRKKEKTKQMGI